MKQQVQETARPERLWTIRETSDFLSVPIGTLYQWHHRGQGPKPYKVGKHLRYARAR